MLGLLKEEKNFRRKETKESSRKIEFLDTATSKSYLAKSCLPNKKIFLLMQRMPWTFTKSATYKKLMKRTTKKKSFPILNNKIKDYIF